MAESPFDIASTLESMVSIYAQVPERAFTASLLGTERRGHGAVIDEDGLILTVGYVISEADSLLVTTASGEVIPGYVVAYDYESGFGLARTIEPLDLEPIPLGTSATLHRGDSAVIISSGGQGDMLETQIIAIQDFAGRWEYLMENAIYVSPAHEDWGGTALLDGNGRLCAVGSLMVEQQSGDESTSANMFMPIDALMPVLDELREFGQRQGMSRPWLGMLTEEDAGKLVVVGVYRSCPAAEAGIRPGDTILETDGEPVRDLASFFRAVWSVGPAGADIPLLTERSGALKQRMVRSIDRMSATVPSATN